jgi:lipoyl synthase
MNRLPEWLRRPLPEGSALHTHETLEAFQLNTVCESARCPNRMECYSRRTATFMILGDTCTRSCGFCAVPVGRPNVLDGHEPLRVAQAALKLQLEHVVVTSVARDELPDEGAHHFFETILEIQRFVPDATTEVLTPDFHARTELIEHVCEAKPTVFNHNLETVERLSRKVRPQASYQRSLETLEKAKRSGSEVVTKSGLMLGLGEKLEEVIEALSALREVGVDMVTMGQYLKPKAGKLEVQEFVHPEQFAHLEDEAKHLGFKEVYSGPYVRSSYHAGEAYSRLSRPLLVSSGG